MINARKYLWKSLMQDREGEGINSCLLLALQRSLLSFAIQKKIEAEVGADGQGLSMADEISSLIPDRRVGGVPPSPCSHRPCSCCSRNVQRPPAAVRWHRSSTSAASSNSQSSSFYPASKTQNSIILVTVDGVIVI